MESIREVRMAVTDTETRVVHGQVWISPGQEAVVSRQQRHGWYCVYELRFQGGRCGDCKRVRGVWVA